MSEWMDGLLDEWLDGWVVRWRCLVGLMARSTLEGCMDA